MATKKTQTPVAGPGRVPAPPTSKQLIGECVETGVRVVHVAQKFYRATEDAIETCGITAEGDVDGVWVKVAPNDVPLKALSMLGKT